MSDLRSGMLNRLMKRPVSTDYRHKLEKCGSSVSDSSISQETIAKDSWTNADAEQY